jgi:hypothetical protein
MDRPPLYLRPTTAAALLAPVRQCVAVMVAERKLVGHPVTCFGR